MTVERFEKQDDYDQVCGFHDGLAIVKLNGKYGFIDKTGKEIIPLIYDSAGDFSEGVANVKSNGKWITIDQTGEEIK